MLCAWDQITALVGSHASNEYHLFPGPSHLAVELVFHTHRLCKHMPSTGQLLVRLRDCCDISFPKRKLTWQPSKVYPYCNDWPSLLGWLSDCGVGGPQNQQQWGQLWGSYQSEDNWDCQCWATYLIPTGINWCTRGLRSILAVIIQQFEGVCSWRNGRPNNKKSFVTYSDASWISVTTWHV